MKVTAVKNYREPGFPTWAILDEHPELLRMIPKRWRGNPAVLAALAMVCVIIGGCRSQARADDADKPAPAVISTVAPIFQHGAGRGAFGCEAINPPVFLSEDEARQVIVEEAKRSGVKFAADVQIVPDVNVPLTTRWGYPDPPQPSDGKPASKPHIQKLALTLDGTDAKRKIAYEFVSESDFLAWETKKPGIVSSVDSYNIVGTAELLRAGLAEARPAGSYAVFYDPAIGLHDAREHAKDPATGEPRQLTWEQAEPEAKKMAQGELRKQVRDFVAWLKAQGVI